MLSNDKVSNFLVDRKEKLVTTPLSEKKSLTKDVHKGTDELVDMTFMDNISSTKYVDKVTDELADMKQVVVKIRKNCLDQYEGQYKGSTGWFKLDSTFF